MARRGRRGDGTPVRVGSPRWAGVLVATALVIDVVLTVLLGLSAHNWERMPRPTSDGWYYEDTFDLVALSAGRVALAVLALIIGGAAIRRRRPPPVAQLPAAGSDDAEHVQADGVVVPALGVNDDAPPETEQLLGGGQRSPRSAALLAKLQEHLHDPLVCRELARIPMRRAMGRVRIVLFISAFLACIGCSVWTAVKGVGYHLASGSAGKAQPVIFCVLVIVLQMQLYLVKRLLDALTNDPGVSLPHLHMHPLTFCIDVACHTCDLCSARITQGVAFQCKKCDHDVCLSCVRQRTKRCAEGVPRGDKGAKEEKEVTAGEYFRWGWRLTDGFRLYVLFALAALCANQGARLFLPNFQGKVIDSVVHSDHDRFWHMLKLYGAMSAGTMLFGVVRLACVTIVSRKLSWSVRNRAFESLIYQDIAYYDGTHTGQLTAIVTQYAMAMVSPINTLINTLLANIILLIGGLIMCVYVSWKLSLLAFTAVGPIIYITGVYAAWSRNINRQIWDKLSEANGIATEAFGNIRTVHSFSTQEQERGKFEEATTAALTKSVRDGIVNAGTYGTTNFLDLGTMVLILGYGGSLVMRDDGGGLTIGQLITFQLYVNMMNNAYQSLNNVVNSFTRAAGAAQKVLAVIDTKPDIDPRVGDIPQQPPEGTLRLEDVQFAYQMRPDEAVLKGLTLDIPARRTTALVGRSGGGKSTLVHLLMRFYDPRKGVVLLDGRPLPAYQLRWYHRHVGVVSQDTQLFAKTIEYNITYGMEPGEWTQQDVELAARRAYAHDFIAGFDEGYQTKVGERGVRLSGGQKQRVAIARAFLRRPRLLFLDEATSALDAEAEHMVQKAIDELISSMAGGCTIVMIAHRLSTVKGAHQIAVVGDGTVLEQGTHDELLARQGEYASLVERQLENGPQPKPPGEGKGFGKGRKGRKGSKGPPDALA